MRAASGAGTGIARTLSVALAALLAFGHAAARAEEPAAESGIVIRKAAVDPADGPAVFVQLFACLPGVIFTLMLEILASPSWWVHVVVSLPVLLVSTVLPLRPIKGWLVASQFYFKAREGRLVREE